MEPPELIAENTTTSTPNAKDANANVIVEGDGEWEKNSNTSGDGVIIKPKPPPAPTPTNVDKFFYYYNEWTKSSVTYERGVKLAQWLAWLSSQLTKNMKGKNQHDAEHYRTIVSPTLRKLYNNLSTMRYILRFYGMPPAIEAAMKGTWEGNWKDTRIKKLSHVMAWSMIFYHPLEHIAFMQWQMPKLKLFKKVDGNMLSAWSCRFWLVFIVSDWISSYLKNCELMEQKRILLSEAGREQGDGSGSDSDSAVQDIDKAIYMNKLQIIRCALFSGPCYTWSLDEWTTKPWLSENKANGLMLTEAIVCIYQSLLSLKRI